MELKNLILKPVFQDLSKMKKHKSVVGLPDYQVVLSCDKNNPKGKFYVSTRKVENAKELSSHTSPHSHTVDGAYIFIGLDDKLKGLKTEVGLGNKKFLVHSPCAVYLPAGLKHTHRYLAGSGIFLKILLTKGKSYDDLTK